MIGILCLLAAVRLVCAAGGLHVFNPSRTFSNSSIPATSSATTSAPPRVSGSNNGSDFQNCTFYPLQYRVGYWSSTEVPITTVGVVYYIIDESTNVTTTTTEYFDQATVTRYLPNSVSPTSTEVYTVDRGGWFGNGTWDVPNQTVPQTAAMRNLDGIWTTLTYPDGLFQVSDSFYWRGTVTYQEDRATLSTSNTGPSSAPGYMPWMDSIGDSGWLPPSPLPIHHDFPNMTREVDPSDPFGFNHVLVHNRDCGFDIDYLDEYFPPDAMKAVWSSCTPPNVKCLQVLTAVHPAHNILGTKTKKKGKKTKQHTTKAIITAHSEHQSIGHTLSASFSEATPRVGIEVANNPNPPTSKPAPGPPLPNPTPVHTGHAQKTPIVAPVRVHPHKGLGIKTRSTHDGNIRTHQPQNNPNPTDQPVIRIGTDTITPNSESQYVISGKTITPGFTATFGSGPSATTVAMSTHGKATYVVVNGEASKLPTSTQPSDTFELLIGGKTLPPGSSVVISGDTYSLAADHSTVFVNGHPEKITLDRQGSVTTLSDGMVVTATHAPVSGPTPQSFKNAALEGAMTVVTHVPELLIGSKTLAPGSSIVVLGTTYSLQHHRTLFIGSVKTVLHILTTTDGTGSTTLPNGVVITQTEATKTLTLTSSIPSASGPSSSVVPATNPGSRVGLSWSLVLVAVLSVLVWTR